MTSAPRKTRTPAKTKSGVPVNRDASTGQLVVEGAKSGALAKPNLATSASREPLRAKVARKAGSPPPGSWQTPISDERLGLSGSSLCTMASIGRHATAVLAGGDANPYDLLEARVSFLADGRLVFMAQA